MPDIVVNVLEKFIGFNLKKYRMGIYCYIVPFFL